MPACELCSRVHSRLSRVVCYSEDTKRVTLVACEDIAIGRLKLAPMYERINIEKVSDKAMPAITDGHPVVTTSDGGGAVTIVQVMLPFTFEYKGTVFAPVLRGSAFSNKFKPPGADGRPIAAFPFWFANCTHQGGHNCDIQMLKRTVPGANIEIPILTNTSAIAKDSAVLAWNEFSPKDDVAPEPAADGLDGGKGKTGKGGKGKKQGNGCGGGKGQSTAKRARKA